MYRCSRCRIVKPVTEFYKQSNSVKGHTSACKLCTNAAMRAYYAAHQQERSQAIRNYMKSPQGKVVRGQIREKYRTSSRGKATIKVYLARHAVADKARGTLRQAVRNGHVQRGACGICGKLNAHGHHEDYTQPLAVLWLCHTHHTLIHQYKSGARTLNSLPLPIANFIRHFKVKRDRDRPVT